MFFPTKRHLKCLSTDRARNFFLSKTPCSVPNGHFSLRRAGLPSSDIIRPGVHCTRYVEKWRTKFLSERRNWECVKSYAPLVLGTLSASQSTSLILNSRGGTFLGYVFQQVCSRPSTCRMMKRCPTGGWTWDNQQDVLLLGREHTCKGHDVFAIEMCILPFYFLVSSIYSSGQKDTSLQARWCIGSIE